MLNQLTPTRFVAGLVVVMFHFGSTVPALASPLATALLRDGPLAVTWFFTLSGFVLTQAYPDLARRGTAAFWWNRFARLYPLYVVALLLADAAFGASPCSTSAVWFLNLTLLQAWVPGCAVIPNPPGWSLSVEVFFYAAFPVLIAAARRFGPLRWAGVAALLWVVSQASVLAVINRLTILFPSALHDLVFYNPLGHLNAFVIGMAGAILVQRHPLPPRAGLVAVAVGAGLSILAVTVGFEVAARHGVWLTGATGLLSPLFALTLAGLASGGLVSGGLVSGGLVSGGLVSGGLVSGGLASGGLAARRRLLPLLGEASYAVYLLQFPLYAAWHHFVQRRLAVGPTADFGLFLTTLVAVALAAHLGIERPCRAWLRGLRRPSLRYRRWTAEPQTRAEAGSALR